MRAIKAARKFIEANPADSGAKVLARLVLALANDESFPLADLYTLEPGNFELAIDILSDWRLDRYYLGKAKLFDISYQLQGMQAAAT